MFSPSRSRGPEGCLGLKPMEVVFNLLVFMLVCFLIFSFMFGQIKSEQGWREPHYGPDMEEKVAVSQLNNLSLIFRKTK